MPEKRYKPGCGPSCIRCWVNNLKHGNEQAKAYLKAHPELNWNVRHGESMSDIDDTEKVEENVAPTVEHTEAEIAKIREKREKDREMRRKRRDLLRCLPQDERDRLVL